MIPKSMDARNTKPAPDLGPGKDGFYEKSVDRFASWVQFEDAKAGAVLVLLGLGLTDVLGNADTLINAYAAHHHSLLGLIASASFWASMLAAGVAVVVIAVAVWPYTRSSRKPRVDPSIFYFKDVAAEFPYRGKEEERAKVLTAYRDTVRTRPDTFLESDMAEQALILAHIAAMKVKLVRWGFRAVTVFLIAWAAARIALGLT